MNERDETEQRPPIGFLWIYAGIAALVGVTALDFEIQPHLYQLLPETVLRASLWESMLYYHAQPPLLNLMLGLAYALEGATGIAAGTSLLLLHLLLGAGAVHALWRLSEALVPGRRTRCVVQALVLLHPVLYSSLFLYFYTLHELFFLSRLAYHAHRYFARHRASDLVWACAMALGLTLSRSIFHPLWALVVLALVLGPRALRAATGGAPRRHLFVVGAAAVLVFAWPCKNLAVFGFFGSCSWQGFHLARGLPVTHPPERSMFFQPTPKAERAHALATSWIPDPFRGVAALSARKDGGWPNWNHYQMLVIILVMEVFNCMT